MSIFKVNKIYVGLKDRWEKDDIAYMISELIRWFEKQVSKIREEFELIMSSAFTSFHLRLF